MSESTEGNALPREKCVVNSCLRLSLISHRFRISHVCSMREHEPFKYSTVGFQWKMWHTHAAYVKWLPRMGERVGDRADEIVRMLAGDSLNIGLRFNVIEYQSIASLIIAENPFDRVFSFAYFDINPHWRNGRELILFLSEFRTIGLSDRRLKYEWGPNWLNWALQSIFNQKTHKIPSLCPSLSSCDHRHWRKC